MKPSGYEFEVSRPMLKEEFSEAKFEEIPSKSEISGYEYAGAGYFLDL